MRLKGAEDEASRHAVMLREGDHRIKNSLHIVANLMTGQARREARDDVREALGAAAKRVRAIAGIHDALQGAGGADEIDLGAVLRTMCNSLQMMAGDAGHIEVTVDAEPLQMAVDPARPLVLVVNELVVNALRHAFRERGGGAIHISAARKDGDLCIVVADNGAGLPHDYAVRPGYGMKLVTTMVRQVGGALLVESVDGSRFTIRIPATASPQPDY